MKLYGIFKHALAVTVLFLAGAMNASADVDPNFHVYICFGQSNMEGNAQWETVDNYVDPRFRMLATCNFTNPSRTMGKWYTANCPIVSPDGKLGPTDYFGRTMVAAMPKDVRIGVLAVAMGGSPIEMFDKDKYKQKLKENPNEWWAQLANRHYGGNPYGRIIEMAKKAQQVGVIKGILLHQGCSNCGNPSWPGMVKKIYNDMLNDLGLQAADVPLFVGEVEYADMGGGCSGHNDVVAMIPSVIPTGHVVSAEGLPGNGTDPWHFSAAGYRMFGKRYAYEALKVMGLPTHKDAEYTMPENLYNFMTPKSFDNAIAAKPNGMVKLKLMCTFMDGHREDLTREATFTSSDFTITDGTVTVDNSGKSGVVEAVYTDFAGTEHRVAITIVPSGFDELGERLTSVSSIGSKHFAIVNELEGKAFYGSTEQNLGYDIYERAFLDTNSGYMFRLEKSTLSGAYLLRLVTPEGTDYSIWDSPGYLNTQPVDQTCCFILGLNGQNGQDIKNGALWRLSYAKDKGFAIKNVGTGKYLHDAYSPAKYDDSVYFSFCTLKHPSGIDDATQDANALSDRNIYDLQGRKVDSSTARRGLYVKNGRKYYAK